MKASTILNCFNHGLPGIHSFDDEFRSQELDELELESGIAHTLFPGGFSFADYVEADKNLITGDELDDKLEHQEMQDDNNNELSSNDDSGAIHEEPEETQEPKVSDKDAIGALVLLMKYCNQSEVGLPEDSNAFQRFLQKVITHSFQNKKQSDIRNYFSGL